MQIEEIKLTDRLEEENNFIDTSDEYIDIILKRGNGNLTSSFFYNGKDYFYIFIGENGEIRKLEINIDLEKLKQVIEIKNPRLILIGQVRFSKIKFDIEGAFNYDEEFELHYEISKNRLGCYFNENKNIDYGVQISDKIVVLVGENNIMKGILINGKFKIENDRFYYEK